MLFAVEIAGAADAARFQDVLELADTLVVIKARMTDKAAEPISSDGFMACSRRGSVNAAWRAAFQPISFAEGRGMASSTCYLC